MLPIALHVAYPPCRAEDERPLADRSVGNAGAVSVPNESNGLRWGHLPLHPGNLIRSSRESHCFFKHRAKASSIGIRMDFVYGRKRERTSRRGGSPLRLRTSA